MELMKNKELYMILTHECNRACVFCNQNGVKHKSPNNELSKDDLLYLFAVCKNNFGWETITLSGGEPLLYKPFDELVKGISSQQGKITLVSNGDLLDKHLDTIRLLERVNVSLHSMNEQKVMANIEKVKSFSPQVNIRLNVVLTKDYNDKVDEMKRLLDFANKNSCSVKYIELSGNPNKLVSLDKIISMLQSNGAEYERNINNNKILFKRNNTDVLLMRCNCDFAKRAEKPSVACNENLNTFVLPNGEINKCRVTNERTSILDEIKTRNETKLVDKLVKINESFGKTCVYEK